MIDLLDVPISAAAPLDDLRPPAEVAIAPAPPIQAPRALRPGVERARRKRRLLVLGTLLFLGAALPTLARTDTGTSIRFDNFTSLTQPGVTGAARFLALYPLVAGLTVIGVAIFARVGTRAAVLTALGSLPFIVALADASAVERLRQSAAFDSAAMLWLTAVALGLLLIGVRVRRYRPAASAARVFAVAGSGLFLLLLVAPVLSAERGSLPLIAPFAMFDGGFWPATGAMLAMGLAVAASAVALADTRTSRAPDSQVKLARIAAALLASAAIVHLLLPAIGSVISPWSNASLAGALAAAVACVKNLGWVVGLWLLLPLGLTDAMLGDPGTDQ